MEENIFPECRTHYSMGFHTAHKMKALKHIYLRKIIIYSWQLNAWSERVVSFELDVDMIMGSSRLSFGIFNKRGRIYNSIFLGICVDKLACQEPTSLGSHIVGWTLGGMVHHKHSAKKVTHWSIIYALVRLGLGVLRGYRLRPWGSSHPLPYVVLNGILESIVCMGRNELEWIV